MSDWVLELFDIFFWKAPTGREHVLLIQNRVSFDFETLVGSKKVRKIESHACEAIMGANHTLENMLNFG